MLASARSVRYLHEPFNPKAFDPAICELLFEREFTHVCDDNAERYQLALARCLGAQPASPWGGSGFETPAAAVHHARDLVRSVVEQLRPRRILMKDPHAVFSADWLARTFEMDVVVLVRHPAAFVGSIKHAGWSFDFRQLLQQPLLMERHLGAFRDEIEDMTTQPRGLVDQGSLLWKLIHSVIADYRERHTDWVFARHEDLSRDPVRGFGEIFRHLELEYSSRSQRVVAEFSGPGNPTEQHAESGIRRNSLANLSNWRRRLTGEEIQRVRDLTSEVASKFYASADW